MLADKSEISTEEKRRLVIELTTNVVFYSILQPDNALCCVKNDIIIYFGLCYFVLIFIEFEFSFKH